MQVKQLEYLMKVVECGSITQASQELYISQPSLSKAIHQLEQEYGAQLLIRKSRGVELTGEGKSFVHYVRGVLTATQALERNFIRTQRIQSSSLFLATQQLDFIYDMALRMYGEDEGKNIHYNIVETDRNEVARLVLSGGVNLGLLVRNHADAKTFLWHKEAKRLDIHVIVSEACCYACIGPKSPFYGRTKISITEAEKSPHVGLDMEAQARESLYFDIHGNHYNTRKIVFFNTVSACEQFLLGTDALAFVSKWTLGCFKDPRIQTLQVEIEDTDALRENELLWLKRVGEPLNLSEKKFLRHVYEYFGKAVSEYPEVLR
ncbi:MAG: LysR family transcriptional regulator [Lachnospiraceae bacterium]|jgi:DNA-binding transcriptional LysR family regulator|nr:LysR family transcriptional regulator [Lachnospiraceae bacterium]MCI8996504.1 LysR family transcriptional regulator [Lachnospiraceae bacterium]MCI9133273.1 LysR family transcriptional regulator [Lachnospiraceae bacterium]